MRKTTRHPFGTAKYLNAKDIRLLRGPYTQVELANKLSLRPATVNAWENGGITPQMPQLRALLKHYNDWTSDLAGPALDLVLPHKPKAHRRTTWQPSAATAPRQPQQSKPSAAGSR